MKKLIFVMAFMLALTACNETEVAVDEVKVPVNFSILKANDLGLTLKSNSVVTPASLVSYPWIKGLSVLTMQSDGSSFNEDFVFTGSDDLKIYCMPGQTIFDINTISDDMFMKFEGQQIMGNIEDKVDELREMDPYMTYEGQTSANITYQNEVQTVPVTLIPKLGRMIVTVNANDHTKEHFDVYTSFRMPGMTPQDYVQVMGLPSYGLYSGPMATDEFQTQVVVTLISKDDDTYVKTFFTSLDGAPTANKTQVEAQAEMEKMQIEAGYDKWVEIGINYTGTVGAEFDFTVKDLEDKKEEINW